MNAAKWVTNKAAEVWNGKTNKKPNPWPQCPFCFHRRPPFDFCRNPIHPRRTCVVCCPHTGSHPREDTQ